MYRPGRSLDTKGLKSKRTYMEDFYYFNRQIDLWEEDLEEEVRHLKAEEAANEYPAKGEQTNNPAVYSVFSKSLNERIEICLN